MKEKMVWIKTVIIGCIIFFIGWCLFDTAPNSARPVEDVANDLASACDLGTMTINSKQMIKKIFGLNAADYDGVIYYKSSGVMDVSEMLIIKLKDTTQGPSVSSAIKERLDSQIKNYADYGTNQIQLLNKSVLRVRGNYFFYAVADNAAQLEKAFLEAL